MKPRRAYALLTVVLMLGIVAILLGTITMQVLLIDRTQLQVEARAQSLWLARSGQEIAAARLLAAADYRGESLELVPTGSVQIAVERRQDVFRVTSEAAYLGALPYPVVRTVRRSYRRLGSGSGVRLEVVQEKER